MPIHFTCPHCGTQTDVAEEYAGQSGACTSCGRSITVPPLVGTRRAASSGTTAIIAIVAVVVLGVIAVAFCGGMGFLFYANDVSQQPPRRPVPVQPPPRPVPVRATPPARPKPKMVIEEVSPSTVDQPEGTESGADAAQGKLPDTKPPSPEDAFGPEAKPRAR
jgi:hypothetical protein